MSSLTPVGRPMRSSSCVKADVDEDQSYKMFTLPAGHERSLLVNAMRQYPRITQQDIWADTQTDKEKNRLDLMHRYLLACDDQGPLPIIVVRSTHQRHLQSDLLAYVGGGLAAVRASWSNPSGLHERCLNAHAALRADQWAQWRLSEPALAHYEQGLLLFGQSVAMPTSSASETRWYTLFKSATLTPIFAAMCVQGITGLARAARLQATRHDSTLGLKYQKNYGAFCKQGLASYSASLLERGVTPPEKTPERAASRKGKNKAAMVRTPTPAPPPSQQQGASTTVPFFTPAPAHTQTPLSEAFYPTTPVAGPSREAGPSMVRGLVPTLLAQAPTSPPGGLPWGAQAPYGVPSPLVSAQAAAPLVEVPYPDAVIYRSWDTPRTLGFAEGDMEPYIINGMNVACTPAVLEALFVPSYDITVEQQEVDVRVNGMVRRDSLFTIRSWLQHLGPHVRRP